MAAQDSISVTEVVFILLDRLPGASSVNRAYTTV